MSEHEGATETAEQPVRRVLVGTDFSGPSEAAVAWAAALARRHGAVLHLVHAVPAVPLTNVEMGFPVDALEAYVEGGRRTVEDLATEWRRDGLEVEAEAQLGGPAQVLLEVAERTAAGVVVVGTRGLTGLRYMLLGSTSRRVVQRAVCPVLAVHPEERLPKMPPWTVLVPTELGGEVAAVLTAILRLFGPRLGKIVLFHAWEMPRDYAPYASFRQLDFDPPATDARLATSLDELASPWRERGLNVETAVHRGFPTDSIVDHARAIGADLVAMSTHGARGLEHAVLGSVAERVVQLAPCPVLTVHPR